MQIFRRWKERNWNKNIRNESTEKTKRKKDKEEKELKTKENENITLLQTIIWVLKKN